MTKRSNLGEKVSLPVKETASTPASSEKKDKKHASGDALRILLNEKEEARKTLRMSKQLEVLAEGRAKSLDMTFNAYVKRLIREDLESHQIL